MPSARSDRVAVVTGEATGIGKGIPIYGIGFVMLGIFWVGHHNQYH
jgi:uncharacterized membrane protein